MSKVPLKLLALKPGTDRLAAGQSQRQRPSTTVTIISSSSTPASIHFYPPRPPTKAPRDRSQAHVCRNYYPPRPLPEAVDYSLSANLDTDLVATPGNRICAVSDTNLLTAVGDGVLPAVSHASLLTPSPVLPPSTPPSAGATKTEETESKPVASSGIEGPRATPFFALCRVKLLFGLCAVVIVVSATRTPLHLASLQISAELHEVSIFLQYAAMQVLVRLALVSPVDCAIHREGASAVAGWTSPGLEESRLWLYRMIMGSAVVPADAVLDPRLPRWSFFGQTGHITLALHRNATLITVIIESDFPDSIPHNMRIWTFMPKSRRGLCRLRPLDIPSPQQQSGGRGLSLLFLGDAVSQAGSTAWERRYHAPRGCYAHVPTDVVMLEFFSDGGDDITRIRLIRVLGIPS